MRAPLLLSLMMALSATLHAAGQGPELLPVQTGVVPVEDGSIRTIVLMQDAADSMKGCEGRRVGLIVDDPKPSPRAPMLCWLPAGDNAYAGLINAKVFVFQAGRLEEFNIDPARLRQALYEWRAKRVIPIEGTPATN